MTEPFQIPNPRAEQKLLGERRAEPCPFCGWSKCFARTSMGAWSVECPDCAAYGPPEETEIEAIKSWNSGVPQSGDTVGGAVGSTDKILKRLEIATSALQKIASLNCASCERYVAEADAIAVDALVAIENIDDAVVKDNVVPRSVPRAA